MIEKSILFLFRKAPYTSALAREGYDALLAAAAFEQKITVYFRDDGVFQLLKNHEVLAGQKNIEKLIAAFEMYDIENIYIDRESLAQRYLSHDSLSLSRHIIDETVGQQLIRAAHSVLSF